MVLDTSLLNTQQKVHIKWSNPGKGVTPFATPRCSSYWKGSLLVALDYGRQLYLLFIVVTIIFEKGASEPPSTTVGQNTYYIYKRSHKITIEQQDSYLLKLTF